METRDVVIVGGGPAGLAAAVELYKKGIRNVLIVEREKTMGGILRQCIHDGFGLTRFGETDRKSTRLNSSHEWISRMPSSA